MADVGRASIRIEVDRERLGNDLNGAVDSAGPGLLGRMGGLGQAAAVGFGAAFAGAAAIGAGLFSIGSQFDDVADTIRIGTGATGDALDGLMDDFRAVAANVPADFGTVATAITDLNSRLDLTGAPLQELSTQFINLANVTGGDLAAQVEVGTRALGDWGLSGEQAAGGLDAIFRASQATGASFEDLAGAATTFGGPMRQLGFSFDQTLALLGRFEAEGVNAELVMGSMRQSLGRMARAGEDPIATFQRVSEEIANAGSAGEANAIALELFGARAGPDMAAAIREGRFEIGELTNTIAGGSETINTAAADTADFAERWQVFKNRVLLALEPIAMRVFDAVGQAFDRIAPFLERVVAWLAVELPIALARFEEWWSGTWPRVQEVARAVVEWLMVNVAPRIAQALDGVRATIANLRAWWEESGPGIIAAVTTVVETLVALWQRFDENVLAVLREVFAFLQEWVTNVVSAIDGLIDLVTALINGDWSAAWDALQQIVGAVWDNLLALVDTAIDVLYEYVRAIGPVLMDLGAAAFGALVDVVRTKTDDVVLFFLELPFRILAFQAALAEAAVGWIVEAGRQAPGKLWDLITTVGTWIIDHGVPAMLDFGRNLGEGIIDGIGDIFRGVVGFGRDLAGDFVDAIKDFVNVQIIDRLNNLLEFHINVPMGPDIDFDPRDIPHLAMGAAVGRPTLAVVGDNSDPAPELVSPVPLMRSTFEDVLGSSGRAGRLYIERIELDGEPLWRGVEAIIEDHDAEILAAAGAGAAA